MYNTDVTQSGGTHSLTTICSTHGLAAQLAQGSTITVNMVRRKRDPVRPCARDAFSVTGLLSTPLEQTASAGESRVEVLRVVRVAVSVDIVFCAFLPGPNRAER